MTFSIRPYRWDIHDPNPIKGIKITTNERGTERFLFVPNTELFDLATKLADYLDSQQPAKEDAA